MTDKLILLLIGILLFAQTGCVQPELYNGRIAVIEDINNIYHYFTAISFVFTDDVQKDFRFIDKNNQVLDTVPFLENHGSTLGVLNSWVVNYAQHGSKLFITHLPIEKITSDEEQSQLDDSNNEYRGFLLKMSPEEINRRMSKIKNDKNLYDYYYYDNDSIALYGPYNETDIFEIKKKWMQTIQSK